MDHKEKTIIEYITISQEYPDHSIYQKYLKEMEKTSLSKFNEEQVNTIIRPFLYQWGKMGRVLGREDFIGWESEVAENVRSNLKTLENFRTQEFLSSSFLDLKPDIIKSYNSFKNIVDRVAATKVLHIICPKFFPLWDNAIATGIGAELVRLSFKETEVFSGEDYYAFMLGTQGLVKRYENTFLELSIFYKKSVVKILDDFLWMVANRPFSLFFREKTEC